MNFLQIIRLLPIVFAGATLARASEPIDYVKQIKPIFKARCYACHGALKQESHLRLDTGALLRKGGDSGAAVSPGKPEDSELLHRVEETDESLRMPPEGEPLTDEQIGMIKLWIAQGAKSPASEQEEEDPKDHWAFRKPVRPPLPQVEGRPTDPHPIDAFIVAQLKKSQLKPRPHASKSVLLRRLYLDLIGLPPTRDELQAFLADDSPNAWTTIVDLLLKDPRYGERWGRHWMDVWRYSDWYGRRNIGDVRNSAPQIWRWRDWIVKSLNEDVGYDRMVSAMLAGDELFPEDREAGYATGFLIRNWFSLNPNDWMRANVEHTGKAFLGLTFNCAHCHDHKYDPISHDNYFQLRAFFEPMYIRQERAPGEADPGKFIDYKYGGSRPAQELGAVRIFDKYPDAVTWFYTGGDERYRVKERGSIPPGVPSFLNSGFEPIQPVELPPRAWYPGLQPEIQQTVLNEAKPKLAAAETQLAEVRKKPVAVPPAARERLASAEAAYRTSLEKAKQSSTGGALAGKQSLLLDATAGRRIIQNRGHVQQLKSLPDGVRFDFRVRILADAHFNFQLAKDVVKGLTASLVAFERGQIVAYHPGGFNQFTAGKYNFADGQSLFQVSLVLVTAKDRCLLTVVSLADDKLLADSVPISLNGWNPVGDATKAITFDARTGAVAVVDSVTLTAPAVVSGAQTNPAEKLLSFDFEPPKYTDGADVNGIEGWTISPYSVAPGFSVVSSTAGNAELNRLLAEVNAARRALESATLPLRAAEAQAKAVRAEIAGINARIAADRARYGETSAADTKSLAQTASRLERLAALHKLEAGALLQEQSLAAAEAKPADDKARTKEISAAKKKLTEIRAALPKARAAVADSNSEEYSSFSLTYPKTSTGRRTALAKWITSNQNPLTARVAVNHIWMRHFHKPLVKSIYDFGRNGAPSTHPQLHDWLAVELMESGWSTKHIHRLIVTSDAYRRASGNGGTKANIESDPENRYLWRMNPGRMEAEVVRDSLLYVSGELDLKRGGLPLDNKTALKTHRRSLYYEIYPEAGGTGALSVLFDAPSPLDCYRRTVSVVPQQALALTNSQLVHRLSRKIVSGYVVNPATSGTDDRPFVTSVFERILSRRPTDVETAICINALGKQKQLLTESKHADPQVGARESLVRALLNHNDFITIR